MSGNIVKRLPSDLSVLDTLTGIDYAEITSASPTHVASDGTYVFVSDTANNRLVQFLASDFSYVADIGGIGSGNDQFNGIQNLAIISTAPAGPAAPSNVVCTPSTNGPLKNTITWDPVVGAVSYNIYWSFVQGTGTGGIEIVGAPSPYQHTGLDSLVLPYYYVVTTVDGALAESAASAEVSGWPSNLLTGFGNIIS